MSDSNTESTGAFPTQSDGTPSTETSTNSKYTLNENGEVVEIPKEKWDKFLDTLNTNASISMGQGKPSNFIQSALVNLDRFGTMILPANHEMSGLTFITRPRLNLTAANLRFDSILSSINTMQPNSIAFLIRALLDTRLSGAHSTLAPGEFETEERRRFLQLAEQSAIFNPRCPFLTPLCNCLTDISGFGDLILETETTQAGYFSEDLTYAKGSDLLRKSIEISVGIKELQNGVLMALMYIWDLYISLQCSGVVMSYPDDIYEQRLNYTVSIYRFMFDPSMEVITGWAKATGCFPRSVPIGSKFNVSQGEDYVSAASKFSVPFVVNHVSYMDPWALLDFNSLVERYWPDIQSNGSISTVSTINNFMGVPYVVNTERGLELKFYYDETEKIAYTDALSELGIDPTTGTSTGQPDSDTPPESAFITDWKL